MEPRASHVLGKVSTTELHPALLSFLNGHAGRAHKALLQLSMRLPWTPARGLEFLAKNAFEEKQQFCLK
jgi:hypothetical protein